MPFEQSSLPILDLLDKLGSVRAGSELFLLTIDSIELPITLLQRRMECGPLHFIHANAAFESLCGYEAGEIRGETPAILQGEETDLEAARMFRKDVDRTGRGLTTLVNYRKDGSAYEVFLLGARLRFQDEAPVEETLYLCCSFLVDEVSMVPMKNMATSSLEDATLH